MLYVWDPTTENEKDHTFYDEKKVMSSGITPPTRNIRKRKFKKEIEPRRREEVFAAQEEMLRLMRGGADPIDHDDFEVLGLEYADEPKEAPVEVKRPKIIPIPPKMDTAPVIVAPPPPATDARKEKREKKSKRDKKERKKEKREKKSKKEKKSKRERREERKAEIQQNPEPESDNLFVQTSDGGLSDFNLNDFAPFPTLDKGEPLEPSSYSLDSQSFMSDQMDSMMDPNSLDMIPTESNPELQQKEIAILSELNDLQSQIQKVEDDIKTSNNQVQTKRFETKKVNLESRLSSKKEELLQIQQQINHS
eukprot:TRINITY_DN6047_c0_g1_i1.p1 TRINITY_DN6047_c0_g1~~TRINITY_DN6047_c0_g1_i1.p1  ORF type:complete len:307 (-),score=145.34 TRINITY_DN6047_c0_g1_i1:28-948(-)